MRPCISALLVLACAGGLPCQGGNPMARPYAGCTIEVAGPESAFAGVPWPNGDVPYVFAPGVTPAQQTAMLAAMQEIENLVVVDFRPRNGEADYVRIEDSILNSSPVGKLGGMQRLRIANWNMRFVMVHELVHVLGFWHEHQRPDRDNSVTIQWANVDPTVAHDFQIVPTARSRGSYDFDSLMHFDDVEGSVNGQPTITVDPPNQGQQANIGQRTHLSVDDVSGLAGIYGSRIPPAISSVSPNSATAYLPALLTVTGQRLDETTRLDLGPTSITNFNVLSPTQLTFRPPSPSIIGNHVLTAVSRAGTSNGVPVSITPNIPPVLVGGTVVVRNFNAPFFVHSDATSTNLLLVALDNLPSVVPGVVSLGIGNQFSLILEAGPPTVADPRGEVRYQVPIPGSIPTGIMLHFQSVLYDLNNLVLPIQVSNVISSRVF